MKKLIIALLVILVLIGGGVFYVASQAGSLIRSAVIEYGPQVTGTTVSLDDVSLSLLEGHAKIKGLAIGNPEGFSEEHIATVGDVEIQLDVRSLFDDVIRINKILVDGAQLTIQPSSRGFNIEVLRREVEKRTAALRGETDPSAGETTGKKMIIDDLQINGTRVGVVTPLLEGGGKSYTIPDIQMQDIGKGEGGSSAAAVIKELTAILTRKIMEVVSRNVTADQVKGLLDDKLDDKLKGATEKLKGLFGR